MIISSRSRIKFIQQIHIDPTIDGPRREKTQAREQ